MPTPDALLLIDVQRNMVLPPEPVPDAAAVTGRIRTVLDRARLAGATVVHIRNNGGPDDPDSPGSDGWQLANEVGPGEHVVDKHECDAFAGTSLADLLPASAHLVVVGMQSEFCIRETSLAALARGHRVSLVRGAHATYDGDVPATETSRQVEYELSRAGAELVAVDAVQFR